MADRGGFEPPNEFPRYMLSKHAPSAARPPVLARMMRGDVVVERLGVNEQA